MLDLEILKAIEMVRSELVRAVKRNDYIAAKEIHTRLISLYAALDVHNVIVAIERVKFPKRAA